MLPRLFDGVLRRLPRVWAGADQLDGRRCSYLRQCAERQKPADNRRTGDGKHAFRHCPWHVCSLPKRQPSAAKGRVGTGIVARSKRSDQPGERVASQPVHARRRRPL
jgi:hypothetical protein